MTIYEVSYLFGSPLILKRSPESGMWSAYIQHLETKRSRDSSILGASSGVGETIELAVENYCKNIVGKWGVVHAYDGKNRIEFGIPKSLDNKLP